MAPLSCLWDFIGGFGYEVTLFARASVPGVPATLSCADGPLLVTGVLLLTPYRFWHPLDNPL